MSAGFIAAAWTLIRSSFGPGGVMGVWFMCGDVDGWVYVKDLFDVATEDISQMYGMVVSVQKESHCKCGKTDA